MRKAGQNPPNYLLCTEDMQSTLRQLWKQGLCILAGGMLCNHLMKICKYQEKQITLPWGKRRGLNTTVITAVQLLNKKTPSPPHQMKVFYHLTEDTNTRKHP